MSCPICGQATTALFERPGQLGSVHMDSEARMDMRLLGCRSCDFVWNATAFDSGREFEAWMASAYGAYRLLSSELHEFPLVDARAVAAVNFLERHCRWPHIGHVLEVGSNRGDFLAYLKSRHANIGVMGVDSSELPFVGVPTLHSDVRKVRFAAAFDLLIARQVLEHTPDPRGFLAHLASFVRKGGYLLIEVPDLENDLDEGVDPWIMEHVGHYSVRSLEKLGDRAGLSLAHIDRSYQLMALFVKDRAAGHFHMTVAHGRWDRIQDFQERVLKCQSEWLDYVRRGYELCFYGASNVFLAVSGVLGRLWKEEWRRCPKTLTDDYAHKQQSAVGGLRVRRLEDFRSAARCIYIVCAMYRYHRQKMLTRVAARLGQGDKLYAMWNACNPGDEVES